MNAQGTRDPATPAGGPAPHGGPTPNWPEEPGGEARGRHGWQDTLRNASDLALLGIVTTLAALPVVTAGAAIATASAALHHWIEHERWPGVRPVLRDFGRALLPGAAATALAGIAAVLLTVNLLALTRGVVPGGGALIAVTAVLTAGAAGFAGLTVVQVGRQGGRGWPAAVRAAGRLVAVRPVTLLATTGVVTLTALLCALILPLITPILAGYALLGLHAVTRRTAGTALSPKA
ncbi:hypothetical protein [Plantactinospora sp. CA-290183]|uniref:hypothetical protein n=1 Tax=Plantactinospora sp. CA-290183 TaxID=3240006 RepID=UPI003D8E3ACA